MALMHVAQVAKAHDHFQVIQKEIPQPGPGQVRIKVQACGICHSDMFTKEGYWPGLQFPRSPGHEVAGSIDAVGQGVSKNWAVGQRVGVGWAGGHCGECGACRRGYFVNCAFLQVPGISYDGGYQQFMVAPTQALAVLPKELSFEEAAPILCAGVTTFNALRHSGARAGDLVAIQGIGGLGHLGIQFANKMGFKTVALSKGKDKEELAKKLGAHVYINSDEGDPAETLTKLGGARVILATAPSGKAITPLLKGLGHLGELLVVGASQDPIEVPAVLMLGQTRSLRGWASGSAMDSEDALNFCALTGIRPMIEKFPLANAQAAYERMMSNKARFRAVLMLQ